MKDNFSKQSDLYAKYRLEYPIELYDFVFSKCRGFSKAWDCATGNGQVAKVLAQSFDEVFATDISERQLGNAFQAPNIKYSLLQAETTIFENDFFDLITVGQALHWFDFDLFFNEVKRVLKPNGVLAVWGYRNMVINDDIDELNLYFYNDITGPYWDDERSHIDNEYETVDFPFLNVETKSFYIRKEWDLETLEGFFNTWSAVQHFIEKRGYNPVPDFINKLRTIWGEKKVKEIIFPIFLKVMRKATIV